MAGLQSCSFSVSLMEVTSIRSPRKPGAVMTSSVSIQKPLGFARRKNHLRPKILKTLRPNPIPPPVTIPTPPSVHEEQETLTRYDVEEESSSVELTSAAEASEGDESLTESAAVEESLDLGKFSTKSVVKFGAYFVGLFLFQTICAVWLLGSRGFKPRSSELGMDEKDKGKSLINGDGRRGSPPGKVSVETGNAALYLDDLEMKKKIEEIRLMASEARKMERKKLKGEAQGGEMEEEDLASKSRVAIENEIGSRLNKLEKRLNSVKKAPNLSKAAPGSGEAGGGLVFKKKLKFKGASLGNNSQNPKGFGLENHSPAARKGEGVFQVLRNDESDGLETENGTKRLLSQKEVAVHSMEKKTGSLHKSRESFEVIDARTSREICPQNSQSFGSNKGSTKKSPSPLMSRQKDDTANIWWLNLPCVFAILMRRGSNSEGPEGLYSLKIDSDEDDESVSSYIIGFEDRVDANNFCYLLDSFFEDLGDFNADIVPLLRKELQEAVKAKTMKIYVLRKGQLRLYAGQPFSDVESELMSLVEEN